MALTFYESFTASEIYDDIEVQKELTRQTVSIMATHIIETAESPSSLQVMPCLENDFNSAKKLMATFRKCFRVWKREALKITGPAENMDTSLSTIEIAEGETHLLQIAQEEAFSAILTSMKQGLSFGKAVSKLPSEH